jgi:predicted TIM-barrel fold metal-dependent hydrolase
MAADTIDCDIHPDVPDIKTLLPYMNEFWQESFVARGIDGFDMMSYPLNAPITCRPDWRVKGQRPGATLDAMRSHALETFGIATAICNPLTGGQVAVSESMGAAICSAVNDWIREHWLDKEPRLRASIVVPAQAPLLAAQEIDRSAGDTRFVQVLIPVACELMLGRSYYWPIWEAAARHGLPIGIHAGSMYRRGVRAEVPWVNRSPAEIIRENIRLTMQPFDAPDREAVERIIEQIDADHTLLFASDYPHWQFEGNAIVPPGLSADLQHKMRVDNPRETYPRLKEKVQ